MPSQSKFWGLLFGVVLLAAFGLTAAAPLFGWWLPKGFASYGGQIDFLFYVILGVTGFFFVLTESVLVYNMLAFGAKPGAKSDYSHGNHRMEVLWTIVPAVILILLAVWQINVWADIKFPSHLRASLEAKPDEFLQLEVVSRQWEYRVRYASPERMAEWGAKDKAIEDFDKNLPPRRDDVFAVNDVHCWKGQKVVVHFKTKDVGHAFFVPALRVKQDALPGRTIRLWFQATDSNCKRVGDAWVDGKCGDADDAAHVWDILCTQYCGTRHSMMRGRMFVHKDKDDYMAWLKTAQTEGGPPKSGVEKVAAAR